jgi:hypothetical protein
MEENDLIVHCHDCSAEETTNYGELPEGWGWIWVIEDAPCYGCPDHKDE